MSAGGQPIPDPHEALHLKAGLLVLSVILLAANLRAAVNVIGPLLPAIRADLMLNGAVAGRPACSGAGRTANPAA